MIGSQSEYRSALLPGLLAGAAGALAMGAMRTFDRRYAPKTIPQSRQDPGMAIVKRLESAVGLSGRFPRPVERAKTISRHLIYGALAGAAYGVFHSRRSKSCPLSDGAMLGVTLYAVGYAGWLPLFGFTRPIWRQSFPEIAGETLRHVAYGVTTAAVFGVIHGRH